MKLITVTLLLAWSFLATTPTKAGLRTCGSALDEAERNFVMLDETRLNAQHEKLVGAFQDADKYMKGFGVEKDAAWREYFDWEGLEQGIALGLQADLAKLLGYLFKFYQPYSGLERAPFVKLRDELRRFMTQVDLSRKPDQRAVLAANAARLRPIFGIEHAELVSLQDLEILGRLVAWFADIGSDNKLYTCTRQHFAHGNIGFKLGARLLPKFDPINQVEQIRDSDGSGYTTGRATTTAQPRLAFVPSKERADLRVVVSGSTVAKTVTTQRRVSVGATLRSQHQAFERFSFDGQKFSSQPSSVAVNTTANIDWIQVDRVIGKRIIEKAARRRAYEALPAAKQKMQRRVEQKVAESLRQRSSQLLNKANKYFAEFVFEPLRRVGFVMPTATTSTTEQSMHAATTLARFDQVSAPLPFEAAPVANDAEFHLHETFFTNVLPGLVGDKYLLDEDLQRYIKMLRDEVPEELTVVAGKDRWSATFAAERPVLMVFRDGVIRIKLALKQFDRRSTEPDFRPSEVYNGELHVEALYQGAIADGLDLKRLEGNQLTLTQPVSDDLRAFIQRKVDALFPASIHFNNIELGGEDGAQPMVLAFNSVIPSRGWLNISWLKLE